MLYGFSRCKPPGTFPDDDVSTDASTPRFNECSLKASDDEWSRFHIDTAQLRSALDTLLSQCYSVMDGTIGCNDEAASAEEGKVEEKPIECHGDHYLHAQNQEDHTATHEGALIQPCSASGTCKTDLARELRELNDRLAALSHADPDDESAECIFHRVLDRYNWIEDQLACVDDECASSAKIVPADSPSPSLDIDRAAASPIPDSEGEQLESRQVAKPCTGDEASRTVDPCKAPVSSFCEVSLAPIAVFLFMAKNARLHVPHIACTVRETFWIYSRIPLAIWDTDSVFYGLRRGTPVRLIGMIGAPHYNGLKGFIQAKAISKLNGLRNVRVHFPEFPRPFGNEWVNLPSANVEPY
jgi:hypothetical protein